MRPAQQIDRAANRLVDLASDLANNGYDDLAEPLYEVADNVREIADAARHPEREQVERAA